MPLVNSQTRGIIAQEAQAAGIQNVDAFHNLTGPDAATSKYLFCHADLAAFHHKQMLNNPYNEVKHIFPKNTDDFYTEGCDLHGSSKKKPARKKKKKCKKKNYGCFRSTQSTGVDEPESCCIQPRPCLCSRF